MNFDVPQYIDIEDKIAFQLTAKQLGWLALGGVGMFFVWTFMSMGYFIAWSVFIGLIAIGFAFVRPYGVTLSSFIGYGFMFLFRPKQYVWKRFVEVRLEQVAKAKSKNDLAASKNIDKSGDLAKILDSRRI